MNQIKTSIVFVFFVTFIQAQLDFHKLRENVYVYTTYNDFNGTKFPSNSMYIVANEGIIIIDTPWDTLQFQPFLDSLEKRHHKAPILAISTHFHDDRTAGLDFFKIKGIKTYTSQLTLDFCKKRNEAKAEFTFLNDTIFTFSNIQIETFYPGEGHSPDNIVIYLPDEHILFGGCLIKSLENTSLGNVADANLKEWQQSVQKVIEKYPKVKIVIPGHFAWSGKKSLRHTINLLKKSKS